MIREQEIAADILDRVPTKVLLDPRDEAVHWHADAPQMLAASELSPEDFLDQGTAFLTDQERHADIAELLMPHHRNERTQRLGALAAHREILVIGRNSYNLANQRDLYDDPRTQALSSFIMAADDYIVTDGRGWGARSALQANHRSAQRVLGHVQHAFKHPVPSRGQLVTKATAALHRDILPKITDITKWPPNITDARTYQRIRREFKSVVDLLLIDFIADPSEEKSSFLKRGLSLNATYRAHYQNLNRMQSLY